MLFRSMGGGMMRGGEPERSPFGPLRVIGEHSGNDEKRLFNRMLPDNTYPPQRLPQHPIEGGNNNHNNHINNNNNTTTTTTTSMHASGGGGSFPKRPSATTMPSFKRVSQDEKREDGDMGEVAGRQGIPPRGEGRM